MTIPYTALLGANDLPGEIDGYGPIPATVARDLAAGGTWRRILTDPASHRLLDYGTTRYQPPAHLAGLVITRDQTCQFPGCRVPAHRCDLDHTIPYNPADDTGPTSEFNLGPRCRGHHQVKQTPGWSVTQHLDGCTTWTTPTGRVYHSQPPPLTGPEPLPSPHHPIRTNPHPSDVTCGNARPSARGMAMVAAMRPNRYFVWQPKTRTWVHCWTSGALRYEPLIVQARFIRKVMEQLRRLADQQVPVTVAPRAIHSHLASG